MRASSQSYSAHASAGDECVFLRLVAEVLIPSIACSDARYASSLHLGLMFNYSPPESARC